MFVIISAAVNSGRPYDELVGTGVESPAVASDLGMIQGTVGAVLHCVVQPVQL
jgi:hypothetical protein